MSGLEGAAAAYALVTGTIEIIKTARSIYEAVQDKSGIPKRLRVVAERLSSIEEILRTADAQRKRVSEAAYVKARPDVERCQQNCQALCDLLDKTFPQADLNKLQRFLKATQSTLGSKGLEAEKLLREIYKDLSTLEHHQIIANSDVLADIKATLDELTQEDGGKNQIIGNDANMNINQGIGDITSYNGKFSKHFSGNMEHPTFNEGPTTYNHFGSSSKGFSIAFFKTSNYQAFKNDLNPKREQDTGKWFLNHKYYTEWRGSDRDDLLWLSADPGTGKSVLSRSLVDEKLVSGTSGLTLYFFFKDTAHQNKASTAVCALLHQLFVEKPLLFDRYAVPTLQAQDDGLKLDFECLWTLLHTAAADPDAGHVVCILDALDECEKADRNKVISRLTEFYSTRRKAGTPSTLKILVTSRPYQDIQFGFDEITHNVPSIRLSGETESEAIGEEIKMVVKAEVETIGRLLKLSVKTKERALSLLLGTENRTYLWIKFTLQDIIDKLPATSEELLAVLAVLPTSVEEAYEQMLSRTPDKAKAKKILQIIVAAQRPLTLDEIDVALSIQERFTSCKQLQLATPEARQEQVRALCGLFVSVVDSKLYLIHQTAKEFLVARNALRIDDLAWKHSLLPADSHRVLAEICITYLSFHDLGDRCSLGPPNADCKCAELCIGTSCEQSSFQNYSAVHWTTHFQESLADEKDKLTGRARELYGKNFSKWYSFWYLYIFLAGRGWPSYPVEMSPLEVMSYCGHFAILQTTALESYTPHEKSCALCTAAHQGHKNVVEGLLTAKADVNAAAGHYKGRTALQAAAEGGYIEIVERLLTAKADVNAAAGWMHGRTALQAAAGRGHIEVVERLLTAKADVNAAAGEMGGRTALQAAAEGGYKDIEDRLLEAIAGHSPSASSGWAIAAGVATAVSGVGSAVVSIAIGAKVVSMCLE